MVYRRALAKQLTAHTGYRWTVPVSSLNRTGFFVLDEYDLDPLDWPRGRIAGVELVTPPLPLPEADTARQALVKAIAAIDGQFNFRRSRVTKSCSWHINIDAGPEEGLDAFKFILGVNEFAVLASNDRLQSSYATPQRHAYGIALLRHLQADPDGALLIGAGLMNFLVENVGLGKRYAANFAKLERGYVELRHFSALSFLKGPDIATQMKPITQAFELWLSELGPFEDAIVAKFKVLAHWLASFRARLSCSISPMNAWAMGNLLLDEEAIADVTWNGSADLRVVGRMDHQTLGMIRDVSWPDIEEALAVVALDIAELLIAGRKLPRSASRNFQALVLDLANNLKTASLCGPVAAFRRDR